RSPTSINGVLAGLPNRPPNQQACSCSGADSSVLRARFAVASRTGNRTSSSAETGDHKAMYSTPIILPLDWTGRIYVLEDEKGQVVGTGSREVCETLMYMMRAGLSPASENAQANTRSNVRAAITI